MGAQQQQLPEWEVPSASKKATFFSRQTFFSNQSTSKESSVEVITTVEKLTIYDRFDVVLPKSRTYFGRSRKVFLLIVGALILLLALILGLGLGLGLKHKSSARDLPLPSNTATFTGDLTYYNPGLGACGITSSPTDSICAVSHIIFDAASTSGNPNNNPLCGKKIRITRYNQSVNGNRSVDVTVVDRCVGCKATDLDLSLSMFENLADEALGRVTGSWAWLD